MRTGCRTRTGVHNIFRSRQPRAIQPRQRRCDLFRRTLGEQRARQRQIVFGRLLGEEHVFHHALLIEHADFIDARCHAPCRIDSGITQQGLGTAATRRRHQQDTDALASGAAGAAGTMLHHFSIVRQISMNDEAKIWEIDAARGNVGRDANPRTTIAQRLQRRGAFVLGQLAGQCDD